MKTSTRFNFGPSGQLFRLTNKKSTRYLYWVFFICLLTIFIYYLILINQLYIDSESAVNNAENIEKQINSRLERLELGLKQNRELLKNIDLDDIKNFNSHLNKNNQQEGFGRNISLEEVYEELKFDNPDGGVWKQGWDVKIDLGRYSQADKLSIFVVPHSHNDPGWIKTFDRYFREQTKDILDNAVNKLSQNPNMRFIWAETSYLSAWWQTIKDETIKTTFKQLVASGQLEIVTGGWVMNDEANVHFSAIISQIVEGHEWLMEHLQVKPKYGWAIDPFGLSPTMAYLLKQMGFEGMVIQRVHYEIKKYLAQRQELEFRWRQSWEADNKPDVIVCHVEPFYSYDVPHTCGPDPKVCCQFDFKRLPRSTIKCPWKVPPEAITDSNVEKRSELLLEQYRKKSMLYKTNSLLVPLGDDFRYNKAEEWDQQSGNYQKLFDYINSRPDWNVEIKFSTLSEYFESLKGRAQFPTLTGDFFTYSDREDHYWSGYYTSKPYFKRFERILESQLRSTEIIYSLTAILNPKALEKLHDLQPLLVYARQNLALFQHHDAITGTAKEVVVSDYANRMYKSLENLEKINSESIQNLLQIEKKETNRLEFVEKLPESVSSPPIRKLFIIDENTKNWYFVVYNSLGFESSELVCIELQTKDNNWCIRDNNGITVDNIQVNRVWDMDKLLTDRIEACFVAHLKALSLVEYSVGVCDEEIDQKKTSSVTLYNFDNTFSQLSENIISIDETPNEIPLETEAVSLMISGADGMLRNVSINGTKTSIRIKFMSYGTRSGGKNVQKSGAYLFLPDGEDAQDLVYTKPKIRITRGSVLTKFETIIENPITIRHQISVINGKQSLEMENEFFLGDRSSFNNRELMVRFYSDIQNEDIFYTDLNGFQMMRRKRYHKIPIQGNVYPMSTTVYIEDSKRRLTVLSGQPLGATSLSTGWVDIFLDRRLMQDDNRGLNQAVVENKKTKEVFKILLETAPTELSQPLKPTLDAQLELHMLLSPPVLMYSAMKATISELNFLQTPFPCNLHLLNLRSSPDSASFSLFLHRFATTSASKCANNTNIELTKLFSSNIIKTFEPKLSQMSLSLLNEIKSDIRIDTKLEVQEMDVNVYRLRTIG